VAPAASIDKPATTQEEPAPLPEHLSLPIWIAQALDAPEASVRIQALDMWAQQGAQAPLDPLVVALDDENDDVRTKAMAIIEQHWAISQKAETEK
jgi:HEAT repeat protein